MKFMWPNLLWMAALLPLLVVGYLMLMRRQRKAVGYSNLGLIRQAMSPVVGWRRKIPPLLLLAAAAALVLAIARPMAVVTLPNQQRTIMLVMDVSGSMKAEDVSPNRITASQEAARTFAQQLPPHVRIGVVAYGGTAHLVQFPTLNREDVTAAINRFQLQRGTAIGSGLIVALDTLFPDAGYEIAQMSEQLRRDGGSLTQDLHDAVEPGSYASAAIVLLTDGQNTTGPNPIEAAQFAASRGVKVFTVGFGSAEGTLLQFDGWSMRVSLDEDTLKRMSNLTHGQYFHAASGADLQAVYRALQSRLVFESKETEVTALFAALAGLLVLISVALSVWWFGRVA